MGKEYLSNRSFPSDFFYNSIEGETMKSMMKLIIFMIILFTLISASVAVDITEDLKNPDGMTFQDVPNEIKNNENNNNLYRQNIETNYNTQKSNDKEIKSVANPISIDIRSDNINQAFLMEDDEIYLNKSILSNDNSITLNIYEIPSNIKSLILEDESSEQDDVDIRLIGQNNLTLYNFKLYINGFKQVNIENINFEYDTDYTDEKYIFIDDLTKKLVINNITVMVERNDSVDTTILEPPKEENNAFPLHINTKAIVENSTIHAKLKESLIDWDVGYGIPQQLPVMITSSDVEFNNNNITVIGNGVIYKSYYSIYGVFCSGNNLIFKNNTININNTTGYSYGLVVRSSNNIISNNNITIESKAYANAIYFARGTLHNNTIRDNYLNVTCTSNKAPWGNYAVAYAIVLEDRNYVGGVYNPNRTTVKHNRIINNTIHANARQTYSIEVFGAIDLNITSNTMYNNGTAPMAIGIIGYNSTINKNNITCTGTTNKTDGTVDYIVSRTTGVYSYLSDGINITDNNFTIYKARGIFLTKSNNILITRNIINSTNYDNTIDLNSTNITIIYNTLTSRNHEGDESVNGSAGDNITVKYNQYTPVNMKISSINYTKVNQTIPLIITLKDDENNPLSDVKLIMTNTENIIELTTNDEGICIYNFTSTTKGKKEVTVRLENYPVFNNQTANTTITVKVQPTLTFNETIGYVNNDITITAHILDENNQDINSGYVLFKDQECNILDNITVINGLVSTTIRYNKTSTTNITATYISIDEFITDAEKTATITIKKAEPIIIINKTGLTSDTTINLTATITDNSTNNITGGKLYFKVNGKTVKDENGKIIYAKLLDGVAMVEYKIPANCDVLEITAVYSGCNNYNNAKTTDIINITRPETTLSITPIESITQESTITLRATLNDNRINTGKIIFKINGKAVKDSNGKVIYAKVVNGQVNIDYTLPEIMKNGVYNITATYIPSNGEKMYANTTLKIIS